MSDVSADNLLDLADTVKAVMEANGNLPPDQLDDRRCESNNICAWVSLLHSVPSVMKVESSKVKQTFSAVLADSPL